jgi:hypothetical protein
MPIYEMEPPSLSIGPRAPPDAWEGGAFDPRPMVRLDPWLAPRFIEIRRRSGVVFAWLFVIVMAWALGSHPLDEIGKMLSEPSFWTQFFSAVVREL